MNAFESNGCPHPSKRHATSQLKDNFSVVHTVARLGLLVKIALFGAVLGFANMPSSAAPRPAITGVRVATDNDATGITDGVIAEPLGKKWNGRLALNDTEGVYAWKIKGAGFGTTKGSVSIEGKIIPVLSWSDTTIVIDPSCRAFTSAPLEMQPGTARITVNTAKSGATPAFSVLVAPAIEGRIFQQCTWWVAHQRKNAKKPIYRYSDYKPMAKDWVPKPLDGLAWGSSHNAIIENVTPMKGGAFSIDISEYNSDAANSYNKYSITVNPSKNIWPVTSYISKQTKLRLVATGWCR